MDRERFRRAAELFDRATEIPAADREEFLSRESADDPELCRMVEELLRRDEALDLDAVVAVSAADVLAGESAAIPGRIAGFELREILGQGGMAVVYRAEQEHPRRAVALKVIRSGPGSGALLKRFAYEAQVLARLKHPGIAQVYEAGTEETPTGPLPWIAMELVDGCSLLEHVWNSKLGVEERVQLLIEICEAVQHAHQKGVIHRDLKPANVMVDREGRVKVLDFGIARVTAGDVTISTRRTQVGELVGTLPYMSPEQVRGEPSEIDTRTDVYSLGALSYETLSGTRPIELSSTSIPESLRRIEEVEPIPLGKVDGVFAGDLETIVAKALAKERSARYSSVAELAADLRRYLADEPIVARPPTTIRQLLRFARKNRALVGGTIATILALVGGIVATGIQVGRTRSAAARAVIAADTASAVTSFLSATYGLLNPNRIGDSSYVAADLLARDAERAEKEFASRPAVLAELLGMIGEAYLEVGMMGSAGRELQRSVGLWQEVEKTDGFSPRAWDAYASLGHYHIQMYEPEAAYRVLGRLVERIGTDLSTVGIPKIVQLLSWFSGVCGELGRIDEERQVRDTALAYRVADAPASMFRGIELAQASDVAEKERIQRAIVEQDADHPATQARERVNLAVLLLSRARSSGPERAASLAEAEALCRESLAFQLTLGEHYPRLGHTYHNLARILYEQGQLEEALTLTEKAVELRREFLGSDHPDLASSLLNLGILLTRLNRPLEAISPIEEAHRIELDHRLEAECTASAWELTGLLRQAGRLEDCLPYFDEVLAYRRKTGNPEELANCLAARAACQQDLGRPDVAEGDLRECLDLREQLYAPGSAAYWKLSSIEGLIGYSILLQGRTEEARPILLEAHAKLEELLPPEHPRLAVSRGHLDALRRALEEGGSGVPVEESDPKRR